MDLSRLLHPRTIAVVGATDREGSYAGETLLNLQRLGYADAKALRRHLAIVFGASAGEVRSAADDSGFFAAVIESCWRREGNRANAD